METTRNPHHDPSAAERSSAVWRFGRADRITLRVLVILAGVAYLGLVLLPQLVAWASHDPLTWSGNVRTPGPVIPGVASPGSTVAYDDSVVWTIPGASTGQWLASLAPTILTGLLLTTGLLLIWRLLSLTARSDPFSRLGVRYMRGIALAVTAYGVLVLFSRPIFSLMVVAPVSVEPEVAWVFSIGDLAPLAVGFLMLAVAECFRMGRQLRDDVEGLV